MKLLNASYQLAETFENRKVSGVSARLVTGLCLTLSLVAGLSLELPVFAKSSSSKHKVSEPVEEGCTEVNVLNPEAEGRRHSSSSSRKSVRIAAKKSEDKSEDKSEKSEKSEKSDKAEKSEKSSSKTGKSDKADKSAKADKGKSKDKKGSEKTAETDKDKQEGGGIFGFGGGKKKSDKGKEDATPKSGEKTDKAEAEDPNAPKWKNDPALVSVLKDISKSLSDSEAVQKLEDPAEKLVARLAGEALEKAIVSSGMQPNRILIEKDRARMTNSMTAEAFESGDVVVSPDLRASVVALWAKKIDGMLTVSVVGDYGGNVPGTENKLGEFIAVIYAKSTVDKGFDIQSQQDVNYWIGKVSDLKIDRGAAATAEKKSYYRLIAPMTARKREFLEVLAKYQDNKVLLAKKAEEDKKRAEEANANQKMAEVVAKHVAEALTKVNSKTPAATDATTAADGGGTVAEKKPEGAGEQPAQKGVTVAAVPPVSSPVQTVPARPSTPTQPETARSSGRGPWESPTPAVASRPASSAATILYPSKALAGQFLTVSIVGAGVTPEPFVDVNFNGANVPTNDAGKVVYQVPEDATPGYSLHLGIASRPADAPGAVNILQPLTTPSGPLVPKVDGLSPVVSARGYMMIEGHSFDGIAERNRVIVDGTNDAVVLASSPVQIVAKVPSNLAPGTHTVSVSTAGLRSNPGQFEFVSVEVNPIGPDSPRNDLRKLGVRVLGTQNKVRLKLTNQTRDVIKLVRGDEVIVVTSGGVNNAATVQAQRLRSGNYQIDTEILM
ncbi:MAG: IPT/TIG domain-containing protein [Candidatus Obscuribacterales bacterium]|nr:IPT/TIG domain-containing protein [Candidatus Obscuribacterales bacterium]